jgi:hypothetical protein
MLAQQSPRSFISGNKIDLRKVLKEYNRNEFHHIYPKAFLKGMNSEIDESCLANICFLSKSDNNTISGLSPSEYRKKLPSDILSILKSNMLPENTFADNYMKFVEERSQILQENAKKLLDGK